MRFRGLACATAFALLAPVGCGAKLNITKSFSLPGDDGPVYVLVPDPQSREQKITVAVNVTAGEPVEVYVVKKADYPTDSEVMNESARKRMESNGFGTDKNTKSTTLTCTIPANTEYRIVILLDAKPGKKSQGTIKLTN